MLAFVTVSLLRAPEPIERLQAHLFVPTIFPVRRSRLPSGIWRSSITVGELQRTVARYLGAERAARSFAEYAESAPLPLHQTPKRTSTSCASPSICSPAPSARHRRGLSFPCCCAGVTPAVSAALKLLDDASEALQYNRDLLQSALDQVRHGLSVFDKDMRLICWNRQFRELLNLPPELGRVGASLDLILRTCAERGDFGAGAVNELVADRLMKLAVAHETFQEHVDGGRRILEIRTSPMPQGGIVTTYSDITERVEAAEALARANETLERRVRERTAELTEVNEALAVAKRKADEANLDKTRFLAAASHDVLQPLNAARLYATSLVERQMAPPEAKLVRNIDASLEAVEEILNVLIEISRLDAGRLEPDITVFALSDVFERLEVEFDPLAREKGLGLHILPTRLWVCSDRRLSATRAAEPGVQCHQVHHQGQGAGRCAATRRQDHVAVCDTGPGIPSGKRSSDLQGVRAAGGDGTFRARSRPRPLHCRAHRQGARPRASTAIGAGPRLDVLGGAAAADARSAADPAWSTSSPTAGRHCRTERAVRRQRA